MQPQRRRGARWADALHYHPAPGGSRPRRGAAAAQPQPQQQQQAPAGGAGHRHHRRQGGGGTTSAQQEPEVLSGGKQAPLQPLSGQAFPGHGGTRYTADSDTIMEAVVKVGATGAPPRVAPGHGRFAHAKSLMHHCSGLRRYVGLARRRLHSATTDRTPQQRHAPFQHPPLNTCTLVQVFCIHTEPNFSLPWQRKRQYSSSSSGFIIQGRRILTNAHCVDHHTQVRVKVEPIWQGSRKGLCLGVIGVLAVVYQTRAGGCSSIRN